MGRVRFKQKRRERKLKSYFIQYLFTVLISFFISVVIAIFLFYIGLSTNIITTSGNVENQIYKRKELLQKASIIEDNMIPSTCNYAVVDKNGNFLYGTIKKEEAKAAYEMIQSGRRISSGFLMTGLGATCYYPIERQQNSCILSYSSFSQYSSAFLRKHLFNPEILELVLILFLFFGDVLFLSTFFGKRVSKKLVPLQEATDRIQKQDLDFQIAYSGIFEVDEALISIDRLKEDLKESLMSRWEIENTKEMQISALAHDLKTPLTVVCGNAELLEDTALDEIQASYISYIRKNASQLEQYIQMLNDMTKTQNGYTLQFTKVDTEEFLNHLLQQMEMMADLKGITIHFYKKNEDEKNLPKELFIDTVYLQRAILNLVSNAIDYTKEMGNIDVSLIAEKEEILFIVRDYGIGFSFEDIKHATKQFYQGDKSRNKKFHYGMGLFIAESIAKHHGGSVTVQNALTGGGEVTLSIKS